MHSGISNEALQAVTLGINSRSLMFFSFFFLNFGFCFVSLVTVPCSGNGCTIKCVQKFKTKDFTENKHPFVMRIWVLLRAQCAKFTK